MPIPISRLNACAAGDLAAHTFLLAKPARPIADLKGEGLHILPIPFANELSDLYLPSKFTNADYPNLVPAGQEVETVAVGNILAVFNWPEGSERYKKVARFTEAFFGRFAELQKPGFHPEVERREPRGASAGLDQVQTGARLARQDGRAAARGGCRSAQQFWQLLETERYLRRGSPVGKRTVPAVSRVAPHSELMKGVWGGVPCAAGGQIASSAAPPRLAAKPRARGSHRALSWAWSWAGWCPSCSCRPALSPSNGPSSPYPRGSSRPPRRAPRWPLRWPRKRACRAISICAFVVCRRPSRSAKDTRIAPGVWAIPLSVLPVLAAIVPIGAQGTSEIIIDLVSLDGKVLAETKTTLVIPVAKPAASRGRAPARLKSAPRRLQARPGRRANTQATANAP